jgi:hypothetical protein
MFKDALLFFELLVCKDHFYERMQAQKSPRFTGAFKNGVANGIASPSSCFSRRNIRS